MGISTLKAYIFPDPDIFLCRIAFALVTATWPHIVRTFLYFLVHIFQTESRMGDFIPFNWVLPFANSRSYLLVLYCTFYGTMQNNLIITRNAGKQRGWPLRSHFPIYFSALS